MKRESFLFFESWYDILNEEKPEVQWEVIHAIMEYVFRENLVELKPKAGMAFKFIRRDIDRNLEKYEEKVEKLRENGKKGGNPNFIKGKENPYYKDNQNITKDNQEITKDNQTLPKITYNVNDNVNDNVNNVLLEKEPKEKKIPKKSFSPPTFEQVLAYANEKNAPECAAPFFDYYTSNGWKIGKNPMKDWQSAFRNWQRNQLNFDNYAANNNKIPTQSDPIIAGRAKQSVVRANLQGW